MKTIAFVSGAGGVGKTSLVYHLAHMLPRLGYPTLAVDLDPHAALSSWFLDETALEGLWEKKTGTVLSAVEPIMNGESFNGRPEPFELEDALWILAGNPAIWNLEGELAEAWLSCFTGNQFGYSRLSSFHRVVRQVGQSTKSAVALIDVGSGLGSITRTAILAADILVFPLTADAFSIHGLKVLGPAIKQWRQQWLQLRERTPNPKYELPEGSMSPVGYIALRLNYYQGRRPLSQMRWLDRIPAVYAAEILDEPPSETSVEGDPHCLRMLRNYGSLMSMAQEVKKPMFDLRPADGALGAFGQVVQSCYSDFEILATSLARKCGLERSSHIS